MCYLIRNKGKCRYTTLKLKARSFEVLRLPAQNCFCLVLILFLFCPLGDRLKLLKDNTRNEAYRTMEDFTLRIKTLAEELKAKQSKERSRLLKKLKSKSLKGMKYSTTRLSMEAVLTEVDC